MPYQEKPSQNHTTYQPSKLLRFFYIGSTRSSARSLIIFILKLYSFALPITFVAMALTEYLTPFKIYADGLTPNVLFILAIIEFITILAVGLPYVFINFRLMKHIRLQGHQLEDTNKALEATVQQRARFVAYVSHELRNPLNGMIGILDTFDGSNVSVQQKSQIDLLRRHCDDLLYIVSDILELSKVDSGSLEINPVPTQLAELVKAQLKFWESRAQTKGLVIKSKLNKDVPEWVMVDPFRFRQILNNLISNAIKHTQKGCVKVSLYADEEKNQGVLEVCDTGSGIPEELQGIIFDPYVQASDFSTTSNKAGTGLGLPIARQLAKKMGGNVELKMSNKTGSLFVVTFDLVLTEKPEVDELKQEEVLKSLQSKTALVIDDVMSNCVVAQALFKKLGIEAETETNAEKAVEKLRETQFDIVLVDDQLGTMTSEEVFARTRKKQPNAKYIAYTGNLNEELENKLRERGFAGFMFKPVQFTEFRKELINVFTS